jgi:hypothetical protein
MTNKFDINPEWITYMQTRVNESGRIPDSNTIESREHDINVGPELVTIEDFREAAKAQFVLDTQIDLKCPHYYEDEMLHEYPYRVPKYGDLYSAVFEFTQLYTDIVGFVDIYKSLAELDKYTRILYKATNLGMSAKEYLKVISVVVTELHINKNPDDIALCNFMGDMSEFHDYSAEEMKAFLDEKRAARKGAKKAFPIRPVYKG